MSIEAQHYPQMDVDSTYECSHCGRDILTSNQPTHDAICARRQASNSQRSNMLQMKRQSSSSALPEPVDRNERRPQLRRDQFVAENKMMNCPDCGKSVREQEFDIHTAHECESNDRIPCEFCEHSIPMNSYTQHVEQVHPRVEEPERQEERPQEGNQRPSSLERDRPQSENPREQSRESQQERPQPQESHASGGGFMSFLQNLIHSSNQSRSQQQPQEESNRSGALSFLSRLITGGNHNEQRGQQQRNPNDPLEALIRSLRTNAERANAERLQRLHQQQIEEQERQNDFMSVPSEQPSQGSVRTIRFGPNGSMVISRGRGLFEPEDHWQTVGAPQNRMDPELRGMDPMGIIMQMLAARGGQGVFAGLGQEGGFPHPEEGLSKENMDSLSVVKFSKEQNKNLDDEMNHCPICLDEFEEGVEMRYLWCIHRFHRKCIDQWLEKHTNCPICKKDFSDAQQNNYEA